MANEKLRSGMTPDEIRKDYAARAEKEIEDQKAHRAFLAKLSDPRVRLAAREAATAMNTLALAGLTISDYGMIGNRVTEVEVLDERNGYEKGWIKLED